MDAVASAQRYLVIFLLLPHVLHSWRSFNVDFTGYRYELAENRMIEHFHVELVPFQQFHALNGSLILARSVNDFNIELVVVVPRATFLDTHFNVTLNGCQMLDSDSSKTATLFKIIASEFRKTKSYFPERCPVLEHRPIILDNYFIDTEKLPPYVPEMNFMAQLNFLLDRKYILKTFLNGSVVNRKNTKRKKQTVKSGKRT